MPLHAGLCKPVPRTTTSYSGAISSMLKVSSGSVTRKQMCKEFREKLSMTGEEGKLASFLKRLSRLASPKIGDRRFEVALSRIIHASKKASRKMYQRHSTFEKIKSIIRLNLFYKLLICYKLFYNCISILCSFQNLPRSSRCLQKAQFFIHVSLPSQPNF